MKKRILLVTLILLALITVVFLFPPYTFVEKRYQKYKFFDFVFNTKQAAIKLDGTLSYEVDSRERNLTKMDTIDALKVVVNNKVDTTFSWIKIKEYPKRKIIPKTSPLDMRDAASAISHELKYMHNPKYNRKQIDEIIKYTVTELTKPRYVNGQRQLLAIQLLIEVILCFVFSGIVFIVLSFMNRNKST